ncbi:hypothetical protein [Stakelama pacifica]|uniref:Uncharacterized protein n=1 Tax=Stakelama pacifica TaxID=517720 RepID=A0A4R6FFA2_9SPHN|nr:hypothetical protein [Stakelama pacifica]TDN79055.1 hypothetical protein EV664_11491 [Stakelama pacifica]GGO98734.1 hypothetical protein GCM10011329_30580 [Stakelama pacifica]
MARLTRFEAGALGLSLLAAVILPLAILSFDSPDLSGAAAAGGKATPLRPDAVPEPLALYARPLFAPPPLAVDGIPPADAPVLIGIAGRIGSDAVAFVRGASGESRTLRPGEGMDGWQLVSLSADAAYFARGRDHVRVSVPSAPGDDGAETGSDPDQ